ncbi:tetratricopeptide repeat protein [Duganella sp. FT135W]|uniref:Tetratricopeptide repeat protein n=1 Tax=Duganella flavida TaxID=2692175 RepID=A0A6L8K7J5_9BURK|nr:tetratricopeptide repeat protein [Duganella flavida]MYM23170.1 tetratricopeptide repeat protein [Duganella flavida]
MSARWLWWAWPLLLAASGAIAAAAAPAATAPDAVSAVEAEGDTPEALYQAALRALDEGRSTEAEAMLARLIKDNPLHAGAWLELAITECGLGNGVEAERLFGEIERRFQPPPGIQDVIASYRSVGCQRTEDARRASWLLSVGRGYDSNVNQGASNPAFSIGGIPGELAPEFLAHPDHYRLLSVSYVRPLPLADTLAIVQLSDRRNDRDHAQDSSTLLLGLEHAWSIGRWRARATGVYSNLTLDGRLYQRQEALQLRAAPPLPLPEQLELAAITNFSHVSYPTRTSYDSNTVELGGVLHYRSGQHQAQLTLSKLHDNGADNRPGGNRDGWFASAQWYTLLRSGLYGEAALTHQHWAGSQVYSPGLIDTVRQQDTSNARVAVQWYVRPNVSLHLEGRLVRNRENISLLAYNSRALQLSWRWDNF